MSPAPRLLVLAALGLAAFAGCGPSIRLVAASNEYFEYCYAADRDAARSDIERRACWTAWQEHYEIGQPPERIDYAHERLVMLDPERRNAIELATGESGESEAVLEAELAAELAAEPIAVDPTVTPTVVDPAIVVVATEVVAPEGAEVMSVFGDRGPVTARARRSPVIPRSRSSACADVCAPDFRACALLCNLSDRGCVDACRHRFRQCSHSCF